MKRAHAVTSASSSSQWLNCSASPFLSMEAGESETTDESREGTEAHEWLEKLLTTGSIEECENREMYQHAHDCLRVIKAIEKKVGGFDDVFVEKRIAINKRIYGRGDFVALYHNRTKALILDYKYGVGVPVTAEDNSQLITYGVAVRKTLGLDLKGVLTAVYQPRAFDDEGSLRHAFVNKAKLDKWEKKLVAASNAAYAVIAGERTPKYSAGSWCRFCNGAPLCPKVLQNVEEKGVIVTKKSTRGKGPKLPSIDKLSLEDMAYLLEHKANIVSFFNKIEKHLFDKAHRKGMKIPGWKIVNGRGSRKWVENRTQVISRLKELGIEDPFKEPQIKNITDVEKEIGKGKIGGITVKSPGKPKLVTEDSPGVEIVSKSVAADLLTTIE